MTGGGAPGRGRPGPRWVTSRSGVGAWWPGLVVLALVMSGCSAGSGEPTPAASRATAAASTATAAAPNSAAGSGASGTSSGAGSGTAAAAPEKPVEIPTAGHTVPGVLTVPAGPESPTSAGSGSDRSRWPVVLMLHGDTGNDTGPGDLFVTLAARLAARGIASLRIDFAGSGPSQQPQTALDYPGMVADTVTALGFLAADPRFDPSRIALLGHSRGGTVAATVAGMNPAVAALVSWSGEIADGADEFPDEHEAARAAGHMVMGGWDFSLAWFDTIESSHALTDVAVYRGPELAVAGDQDNVVPPAVSDHFIAMSQSEDKTLHLVAGADHGMGAGTPQADETLTVTVDWLTDRMVSR